MDSSLIGIAATAASADSSTLVFSCFQSLPVESSSAPTWHDSRAPLGGCQCAGCVSESSIPAAFDDAYFDALQAYAESLLALQSPPAPAHARAIDAGAAAIGVDDCVAHDMAERIAALFSDDEIEVCGYLGWLQR